jgi:hypothetical protein
VRAAAVGLLLLGWGLGLGPLAHAALAHGEPLLHDGGDQAWVAPGDGRPAPPAERETLPHHHAPGALEHLRLAITSAPVDLCVSARLLEVAPVERGTWRGPALRRCRRPEVPGAP